MMRVIRKSLHINKAAFSFSCLHLGSGSHLVQENSRPANACGNETKVKDNVYKKAPSKHNSPKTTVI